METTKKARNLEILDKYFTEVEGLTYKELYTIYNLGDPFIEPPLYLGIPVEIQRIVPTISLQEFLSEQGYWEKFLKHFKDHSNEIRLASFEVYDTASFCANVDPEDWIRSAFIWKNTSEWKALSDAWELVLNRKFKSRIIPTFYEE